MSRFFPLKIPIHIGDVVLYVMTNCVGINFVPLCWHASLRWRPVSGMDFLIVLYFQTSRSYSVLFRYYYLWLPSRNTGAASTECFLLWSTFAWLLLLVWMQILLRYRSTARVVMVSLFSSSCSLILWSRRESMICIGTDVVQHEMNISSSSIDRCL